MQLTMMCRSHSLMHLFIVSFHFEHIKFYLKKIPTDILAKRKFLYRDTFDRAAMATMIAMIATFAMTAKSLNLNRTLTLRNNKLFIS